MILLRSGHTRQHVAATNHSVCTVGEISRTTRRSNKLIGVNVGIFKEILVSAEKFVTATNYTNLSDLILCNLLQRQNSVAEAKIFTKIL